MAGMIVSELPEEAQSGGERLASRHELLSNVALMQLTPPARRFLHRRIGKVLEAEIDDHYSAATLWDCAKHWQLAGDHAHAWHLATSCAAHLMKIGLPTAAAQAYQQSLNFCSTDNERLDVLSAQAVAFYSTAACATRSRKSDYCNGVAVPGARSMTSSSLWIYALSGKV
jgi:hypothetical protein